MSRTNKDPVSTLPTTLFSNRLFLIIIFIVLELFIVLFFLRDYRRHDDLYRTQMMQALEAAYKGATASYDHTTQMIFNDVVNKPEVLKLIASALDDKSRRAEYRSELYRLMLPSYEKQKDIGILQVHFHLKDGTGFLRMHAPEKYGDNLFRRTAVYQVNKEQKPVKGYEVGYFADGYRYMYPLFYNGRHVGSVEFAITDEGIINHLNQLYPAHYIFMIDRTIVNNMTYTDWKKLNYKEYGLSDRFVIKRREIEDATITAISRKLEKKVGDRLAGMERFVEKETENGKDHLIAFLPVKDVTGKPAAYIVQYLRDGYSGYYVGLIIFDISLFTMLLAGIFYSIYNIQSKRRSLEQKNIELEQVMAARKQIEEAVVKSENLLSTIIDNEPECVKLLARDGSLIMMNSAGLNMIQARSFDQVKGKCVYPLVSEAYREAFENITGDVFRGGTGKLEYEAVGLEGGHIWLDTHAVPLRNEKGEIFALLGITRDITERRLAEQKLKKSESRLSESQKVARIGSWSWDVVNNTLDWSDEAFRRFDKDPETFTPTVDFFVGLIHPEDIGAIQRAIQDSLENDAPYHIQPRIKNESGREWVLEGFGMVERDDAGKPVRFAGTVQDITGRKKAEEAMRNSEERYRTLFEGSPDAIFLADPDTGEIVDANPAAALLLDKSRNKIIGMHHTQLAPARTVDSSVEKFREHVDKNSRGEGVQPIEHIVLRSDGTEVPVDIMARLITISGRKLLQGVFRDITGRKKMEDRIRASLEEKDILLKEIHHRVKNNMTVIYSLLDLQTKFTAEGHDREMLNDAKARIKAMALIHEKLYRSKDMAKIDFSDYLGDILNNMFMSYVKDPGRIALKIEVRDVALGIDDAIPCGLLINELVSNTLKHAFPGGRKGEITVNMLSYDKDMIELIVADNGIGLPADLESRKKVSMGLSLVDALVRQLHGKIEIHKEEGTKFRITFRRHK